MKKNCNDAHRFLVAGDAVCSKQDNRGYHAEYTENAEKILLIAKPLRTRRSLCEINLKTSCRVHREGRENITDYKTPAYPAISA